MKPGDMLAILEERMVDLYNELDDLSHWQSLLIDYEQPVVHQLWKQHGDVRVCVHKIFPCKKPLLHPHPWPSAVCILDGKYRMEVRHQTGSIDPWLSKTPSLTTVLVAGSMYEMIKQQDWHSVEPIGVASVSVMVMGKPYPRKLTGHDFGRGQNKVALTEQQIRDLAFEAKEGLKWLPN